jgi:hypothetical protein
MDGGMELVCNGMVVRLGGRREERILQEATEGSSGLDD